jgi:hypothetical protein
MPYGWHIIDNLMMTIDFLPRYCIPMDSPRPVTKAEEDFFSKVGTGKGKKRL